MIIRHKGRIYSDQNVCPECGKPRELSAAIYPTMPRFCNRCATYWHPITNDRRIRCQLGL